MLTTSMSLDFSTFLGGRSGDQVYSVAVDEDEGVVYVSGDMKSRDFPSDFGSNPKGNQRNSYVARFDLTSGEKQWIRSLGKGESTYLALGPGGNVYVTGATADSGFLGSLGAGFDVTHNGGHDVYVLQLDHTNNGVPIAGTFLGGGGDDVPGGIVVDDEHVYVTGYSASTEFPTLAAYDATHGGGEDGVAVKLSADLSTLSYSTYLGGTQTDRGDDIAVDEDGNAYIVGRTLSGNFLATPTQFGPGGGQDVFLLKLDALGTSSYGAMVGGSGVDGFEQFAHVHRGVGIEVDASGSVYLSGETTSTDFQTTTGALNETFQGGCGCSSTGFDQDAFVTRIDSTGTLLVYSTYLGGPSNDHTNDLAIDTQGNVYLTGSTFGGTDFPTTPGAFDEDGSGNEVNNQSTFVAKLNNAGNALVVSSYLAGTGGDHGDAIAVDSSGAIYVVGRTTSADFPASGGAFDETHNRGEDGFVTKFSLTPPVPGITVSPTSGLSTDESGGIASFSVVLDTQPTAPVTIDLSSSDDTEGEILDATNNPVTLLTLGFDSSNWDQPQTVTVRGVDDPLTDGDIDYDIITAVSVSADPGYSGLNPSDVAVTNQDNDGPVMITMHVADLDGITSPSNGGKWNATVTIAVRDGNGNVVANATVSGSWSAGASGSSTCTTDASGQCTVTKNNIKKNIASVTFSVTSIAHAAYLYEPDDNVDPDGDSDGTDIIIVKP